MFNNNLIDTEKNKPYQESPGIIDRMINLTNSTVRYIKNGFVNVSDLVKKERLDICQKCDKYSNENPENPTCNECGCFLNIKTAWASESCPLKKWSAIATQSSGGCGGCGSK